MLLRISRKGDMDERRNPGNGRGQFHWRNCFPERLMTRVAQIRLSVMLNWLKIDSKRTEILPPNAFPRTVALLSSLTRTGGRGQGVELLWLKSPAENRFCSKNTSLWQSREKTRGCPLDRNGIKWFHCSYRGFEFLYTLAHGILFYVVLPLLQMVDTIPLQNRQFEPDFDRFLL